MSKATTMHFFSVITDALGDRKNKISNNEIRCACPFHKDGQEKHFSFNVNMQNGLWLCHTCGERGNIVQLVSRLKEISEEDAKELILDEVGFLDVNEIPYSLEQFSKEKNLPVPFLQQNNVSSAEGIYISFPYYDEENNLVKVRYRKHPYSETRFSWSMDNNPTTLYGLWKLNTFEKKYIVLVEGETDALSLWYHNIPTLGVPGANAFKKEYAKILEQFEKVYIHLEIQEENDAYKKFLKAICQSGISYDKLYKFASRDIDESCKDPSDLQIKGLLDKETLLKEAQKVDKDYFDEVNKGKRATEKHVVVAEQVLERLHIKYYKGDFYVYKNGVYREGYNTIEQCIISINKNHKKATRSEILDYLRIVENIETSGIDKNLVNFKNGIYNMATDTLEPHNPETFTLGQVNASYLNDEELQRLIQDNENIYIDSFLNGICNYHTDRVDTILEFLGYSMTYDVSKKKCLFLTGESGDNGKSTFLELSEILFGNDSCCSLAIEKFAEKYENTELADKILNVVHEVTKLKIKDLSIFKTVIAGGEITVQRKYGKPHKIRPLVHHIFAMNNLPNVKDCGDEAYFNRLHIVPFEKKFSYEEQEAFDFNKLITPSSLNYLANIALRKYLKMKAENRRFFSSYQESNDIISEYKTDDDNTIALFLNDSLNYINLLDKNNKVIKTHLYEQYCNWCYSIRKHPYSKSVFYQSVLATGIFIRGKQKNGYDCFEYKK